MNKQISHSYAIAFAWKALKENGIFLLGIFMAFIILLFPIALVFILSQQIIFKIITGVLLIAILPVYPMIIVTSMLYIYDIGKIPYRMLLLSARDYFHFSLAFYLLMIFSIAGLPLLIFPGIFLFSRFFAAPFLVIDRKWEAKGAIFESSGITNGLKLSAKSSVFFLINIIGALMAFLGLFISIPLSIGYITYVYRQIKLSPAERVFEDG